jgi:hypothetical protein
MEATSRLPKNVFIINPKNSGFIEAGNRKLGGTSTMKYLLKFVSLFYFSMALPIAILIAVVFSLLGQGSFGDILLFEAFFMILLTVYITFQGYKIRHVLETKGIVLVGEVAAYDTRRSFSASGYQIVPRLKYRFHSRI